MIFSIPDDILERVNSCSCEFDLHTLTVSTHGHIYKTEQYKLPCKVAVLFLETLGERQPVVDLAHNINESYYLIENLTLQDGTNQFSSRLNTALEATCKVAMFMWNPDFMPEVKGLSFTPYSNE